jgi:PAS domain S-box-containing protein
MPSQEHNDPQSGDDLLKTNEELTAAVEWLQHEVATREHERLVLRTIIDNLPDAIYAKDIEGRKTLSNPADVKNIGLGSEAEVLGKDDFDLFPRDMAEHYVADDQMVLKKGEPLLWREEYLPGRDGVRQWLLTSKIPMKGPDGTVTGLVGIGRDITLLKEAEKKLEAVHKDLIRASRVAGMAEVATSVLHNVGNVLNNINVSATVLLDRLTKLKIGRLFELTKIMRDHEADLPNFLTNDPRGTQIVKFMQLLAENLDEERNAMRVEVDQLALKIDHIKQIVAMQQNYAKVSGVIEKTPLLDIVEDALNIHSGAYARHDVAVVRQFEFAPTVFVDRHKVLQILGNLLSNAKYACDGTSRRDKHVIVRVQKMPGTWVRIDVTDNGMGIPEENLNRIFGQGFTTRREGHGFGLHSSVIAAREIGGALTVHSDGPGLGATFTLELSTAEPVTEMADAEPTMTIGAADTSED